MTIQNPSEQFIALYQSVYQNLHSSWGKDERSPSHEAIAVLRHFTLSGPLTVSESANHFNRSQSAMSELIDRLQANGYVDRIKDDRDKRKTLVWLTKNGRDILKRTQQVLDIELLEKSMQLMSAGERSVLINSMKSLMLASQTVSVSRRENNE